MMRESVSVWLQSATHTLICAITQVRCGERQQGKAHLESIGHARVRPRQRESAVFLILDARRKAAGQTVDVYRVCNPAEQDSDCEQQQRDGKKAALTCRAMRLRCPRSQ